MHQRTLMPAGCFALVILAVVLLLPFFLADIMLTALSRLGLSPTGAALAAIGIFFGGMINIPVKRFEREAPVEYDSMQMFGLGRLFSGGMNRRTYTVIAVNVGGCLVPTGLAIYELNRLAGNGPGALVAAVGAITINVVVCYWLARPVPNVGISMPALVPAIVAALSALLLLPQFAPPVAFMAGVLGPLIGADILHLNDIQEIGAPVASIGGAGTFDGIVISGLTATLLA